MQKVDLSQYQNVLSRKNQIARFVWNIVWLVFARPLPRNLGATWKRFILRLFGAKIHRTANIYSSVKIYCPWNLQMEEYSCLAPEVDCYNVAFVKVGAHTTISQKTYLCTASHDITNPKHPLITAPIIIQNQAWIAADAFISLFYKIGFS